MYVFSWSRFAWGDKVWHLKTDASYAPWDMLHIDGDILLCLGDTVAWPEQVTATYTARQDSIELLIENIVRPQVIEQMHRFVRHWFTTYMHTIPLWLWHIDDRWREGAPSKIRTRGKVETTTTKTPQMLVVFPDIWTMRAHTAVEEREAHDARVMHSAMTVRQKKKAFWDVALGKVTTVYATPSQIFHNWHHLTKIHLVRQHQWRYKHAQEPRYDAVVVTQKMAEIEQAQRSATGHEVIPILDTTKE